MKVLKPLPLGSVKADAVQEARHFSSQLYFVS